MPWTLAALSILVSPCSPLSWRRQIGLEASAGGMCCWRWLWGSTYRAASLLVATALVHGKVGISEVDGLGDPAVLALADRTAGWRAMAGRGGL
jgi:hypothetical protein